MQSYADCGELGSGLRFSSMVAGLIKSADCQGTDPLAATGEACSADESREYYGLGPSPWEGEDDLSSFIRFREA